MKGYDADYRLLAVAPAEVVEATAQQNVAFVMRRIMGRMFLRRSDFRHVRVALMDNALAIATSRTITA